MKRLYCVLSFVPLIAFALYAGDALPQSYPSRPVRIVVPVSAGGAIDAVARLIGQQLAERWKQPVLIENRAGAGETIGANLVAKAAPDGYTLLASSSLATSAAVHSKLPYDPATDFVAVTQTVASHPVLVVGSKLAATSVRELINLAKSRPGQLSVGHAGIGSALHLHTEELRLAIGINNFTTAIPYKGAAPAYNALLAGEVDIAVIPLSMVLAQVKAGRLRALGLFGTERLAKLPDVPTLPEAGIVGVQTDAWNGLFAPAKTPRDIVRLIQREVVNALNVPSVRDHLHSLDYGVVGSTPEEFDAKYKADLVTFARVVKEARVPMQD